MASYSQSWVQIDNKVYLSGGLEEYVHIFELDTKQFTANWMRASTINNFHLYACLAGKHDILYYLGGYDHSTKQYYNTLKMLNISNSSWSSGPNMNTVKANLGCIVSTNDKLYAIGGLHYGDKIEYIPINDIYNQSWKYTVNPLTENVNVPRAVVYNDLIFVVGGKGYNGGLDKVHIIDTVTDTVSLSNYRMVIGVYYAAPIVIDNVIYAFGGQNDTFYVLDNFQYWTISTNEPTKSPSIHPTIQPSFNPTQPPSMEPSSDPTSIIISSNLPSIIPTTDQGSSTLIATE